MSYLPPVNQPTPPQGTPVVTPVPPTKAPITGKMWWVLVLGMASLGAGCCYGCPGTTQTSIIGLVCILVFFGAPAGYLFKLERERIAQSPLPQKWGWMLWIGLGLVGFSVVAMFLSSIFVGLLME